MELGKHSLRYGLLKCSFEVKFMLPLKKRENKAKKNRPRGKQNSSDKKYMGLSYDGGHDVDLMYFWSFIFAFFTHLHSCTTMLKQ